MTTIPDERVLKIWRNTMHAGFWRDHYILIWWYGGCIHEMYEELQTWHKARSNSNLQLDSLYASKCPRLYQTLKLAILDFPSRHWSTFFVNNFYLVFMQRQNGARVLQICLFRIPLDLIQSTAKTDTKPGSHTWCSICVFAFIYLTLFKQKINNPAQNY